MAQALTIKRLPVGTEILGLNPALPIDLAARDAIYDAWIDSGLVIFRGVEIDTAQLITLSRCFGDLEPPTMPELCVKDEPLLMELGRRVFGQGYVIDEHDLRLGVQGWHRDTGFTPTTCKGALLYMTEIPPEQGETLFADCAAAYDALPQDMQEQLEGLEVHVTLKGFADTPFGKTWNSIRLATDEEYAGKATFNAKTFERYPPVIQPIVVTHPESGRKCIFLSPQYLDFIVGMPPQESEALLHEIIDHTTSAPFRYMHVWKPGDIVAWDNRRFMHAAMGYHPKYQRTGYRTTFAGPLLKGRYADGRPTDPNLMVADY